MKVFPTMAYVEVTHFALDATRVAVAATADA